MVPNPVFEKGLEDEQSKCGELYLFAFWYFQPEKYINETIYNFMSNLNINTFLFEVHMFFHGPKGQSTETPSQF